MLLALNAFKGSGSTPPPAASRTSIGLLLALTRPLVTGPIEPVEPPASSYAGGASRGRMIRKFRKRREEEEEPIPVIGSTPVPEVPPAPTLPPQPSLMAHMPSVKPAKIPKRADPDEEEDEIALLLELLS